MVEADDAEHGSAEHAHCINIAAPLVRVAGFDKGNECPGKGNGIHEAVYIDPETFEMVFEAKEKKQVLRNKGFKKKNKKKTKPNNNKNNNNKCM